MRAFWICAASSFGGGMLMFFLDPTSGRRRRHMARDRTFARWRRMGRGVRGMWRGAAAESYGMTHRIVHLVPKSTDVADDETLRQRVESQLFRDRHIPKGELNISCEHGLVILRGELDTAMEITYLETRVQRVPGVRGVHSLLHTHGTPAPNKQRSWAAAAPPPQTLT